MIRTLHGYAPDPHPDTERLSDLEIFARTLWGECRSGGYLGMQAVANVVVNRERSGIIWWGMDARGICLHPYQFSCWLMADPNRLKLLKVTVQDRVYVEAVAIASLALGGKLHDITNGATSYYASSMKEPPAWAEGLTPAADIGQQLFFVV